MIEISSGENWNSPVFVYLFSYEFCPFCNINLRPKKLIKLLVKLSFVSFFQQKKILVYKNIKSFNVL